jgi:hypothetical protein
VKFFRGFQCLVRVFVLKNCRCAVVSVIKNQIVEFYRFKNRPAYFLSAVAFPVDARNPHGKKRQILIA